MTELKEELKPRADESSMEWTRRTRGSVKEGIVTEEEWRKHSPLCRFPDETTDQFFERQQKLHELDRIEHATEQRDRDKRARKDQEMEKPNNEVSVAAEESTRSFRLKSQEKDVEKAVSEFEAAQKRLFRDGVKLYSDDEHGRRLGELTEDLRETVEAVASEAATDTGKYEQEALALSYVDPLVSLMTSERERVSASMPLVREDCETMPLGSLVERMRAVAAGVDKPSKLLHARYGLRRCEAENARLNETRQSTEGSSVGNIDTAALRELKTVAEEIAEELKDPAETRKRETASEAARKSHQIVTTARSKLSQADGTAERARREQAEMIQATF
jgi:hypothetical protein